MAEVFDFGLQQHKIKMDGKFFESNLFAVAGDTGRRLEVQLLDSNNMVQNTTGISLRLNANVAGQATYAEATLVDATQGLYELDLPNGMLISPGNWQFQWQIIGTSGERLHSFAFTGSVGSNLSEGGSEATNFYLNADELKQMQDDLINGTFDSEVLETNIAEKLTDLETQYAPKLTEVTAQLAQKATYNADKFLYQSGRYNKSLQDLNDKTTKNNVVFIGDSLFGYDPVYYKNGGNTDVFKKILGDSGISTLTGFVTIQDNHLSEIEWGFSGRSYKGVTGNLITHRTGSDKPYNDIDIYFGKYVGGGTFRYRTFNGTYSEWTTVDTNDVATNLGIININNIGVSTTPTLYIEVLSGTVYIYGIKTYTLASTGIVPYFINEGGTKASQWAVNSTILKQFLQAIAPKQVHVWLGTNDSPTDDETTYIANLKTVLGHIKTAISDTTDVIVYTTIPYSNNPAADARLVKYRDLILDNMIVDDYSVFDLRTAWSDWDASWYVDGVHPVVDYAKFNFGLISNLTTTRDAYSYVVSDNVVTGPTGLRFKLDKTIGNVDDTKKITFKSDRLTFGYMEIDAPNKGVINLPNGGSFIESNTKREMISVRSLKMGLLINSTTLADEGTYREHVTKHVDIVNTIPVTTTDSNGLKMGTLKDLVLYNCANTNLSIMPKVPGGMVYLPETDSANGGTIAFWDGANWRSMHDKTIVG